MRTNDELVDHLKQKGMLYDEAVESAMRRVDRIAFVDPRYRNQAYEDRALPLMRGEQLSQPTMVALMMQHLSISPGMTVLDVGAGSGYQAAILSELVGPEGEVYIIRSLGSIAGIMRRQLSAYPNIFLHIGSSILGLKRKAPFDRILVSSAAPAPPQTLISQLSGSGKMVIPISHGTVQRLTLVEKFAGRTRKTDLNANGVFTPLI